MDIVEQIVAFATDLDKLVSKYGKEFNLPAAAVIGILHMQIRFIEDDVIKRDEEEDEHKD